MVSSDLVHSLFELLEIVTHQDPRCVPDIQQIISEVQEGIPTQSVNAEEDFNENDKLSFGESFFVEELTDSFS